MRALARSLLLGFMGSWVIADQLQTSLISVADLDSPCQRLSSLFPGAVAFPDDPIYEASQTSYWTALQSDLKPSCRFLPLDAHQIQQALATILIPSNTTFAIASGGHSSNAGASNINEGITIDLSRLNEISVDAANATVALGPGARWADVYDTLAGQGLTVPGARQEHVGVGGFVLGGGFSWFAHEYGFTADSVVEFEVVTPAAEVLTVNASVHADLFWALKGSLGAFGIVTRLSLPVLPDRWVYAGVIAYRWRFVPRVLQALDKLIHSSVDDPATQGIFSFGWSAAEGEWVYSQYLLNTDNVWWNPVFAAFKVIRNRSRTLRTTTIGGAAGDLYYSPEPMRRSKFTLTCRPSFETMFALHELVLAYAKTVALDPKGLLAVTYQPLTVPHLRHQGNIFNLGPAQGPLLLVAVDLWWTEPERDRYFQDMAVELRTLLTARAQQLGAYHPWIYPNYAALDQDPFGAPGALSPHAKERLIRVRQRYDPHDTWRKLVPGIWHI